MPEVPSWQSLPPQSIPDMPPVTGLPGFGFPVVEIPGCVETRDTQPGNKSAYDNDPKGNYVVCGGQMPSYRPLDFTPGTLTYGAARPPLPKTESKNKEEEEKKPAGDSNQPESPLPSGGGIPDIPLDSQELPCPPPDGIPIGAKGKNGTAIIIGYEKIDGECIILYEKLPVLDVINNYLPPAPVAMSTAAIAATAATSAIVAKPLGDYVLKLVKPTVKKIVKKVKTLLGKKVVLESVGERRKFQRSLKK